VTAGRAGPDRLARLLIAATLLLGSLLRAWCFVGWGLPDDAYYASAALRLAQGRFDLLFGSNYRLGLHLPNALSLRLFGVSDVAFVLFPLACSLATIPLTYLIGRRLRGARAGLLAAASSPPRPSTSSTPPR
jgi:4-amino-4-deoxy-L-arabinose transferase-like glycosyltransferase